jgi:hypothetical protein
MYDFCDASEVCVDGYCVPCSSTCEDKECGPDGCGGECGVCAANAVCTIEAKCQCIPDCKEKECGDDGCGGSCGDCDDGDNGTVDSCDPIAGCKHAKKECIPELPDPCKVCWDDPATGACLKAPKDCDDGSRKRYRVRKGKRSSAV